MKTKAFPWGFFCKVNTMLGLLSKGELGGQSRRKRLLAISGPREGDGEQCGCADIGGAGPSLRPGIPSLQDTVAASVWGEPFHSPLSKMKPEPCRCLHTLPVARRARTAVTPSAGSRRTRAVQVSCCLHGVAGHLVSQLRSKAPSSQQRKSPTQ